MSLICFCSLAGHDVLFWCIWEHSQAFCCKIFVPELISAAIGVLGDRSGNILCVYDRENITERQFSTGVAMHWLHYKHDFSQLWFRAHQYSLIPEKKKKNPFLVPTGSYPQQSSQLAFCEWLRAMAPFNTKVLILWPEIIKLLSELLRSLNYVMLCFPFYLILLKLHICLKYSLEKKKCA